jgi:hypothetical protein
MSCDGQRKQSEGAQRLARRGRRQREQCQRQRELRHDEPRAAPPAAREVEAVHERRPDELEGVGQADQRQKADVGDA